MRCLAPLYSVHDGQDGPVSLFEGFRFLHAEEAKAEKARMDQLAQDEDWEGK